MGITFRENGPVDVDELNALYRLIGWDSDHRRTGVDTAQMLRTSHYYIAAHTDDGGLVGFARICGDPYVVQLLDVITHPDHRRRGIATACMQGVAKHLRDANYASVTCTAASGLSDFYERFGFRAGKHATMEWKGAG